MSGETQPPAMTGTWIEDHGEQSEWAARGRRYEVRFAFEGETHFPDMATAQLAVKEYAKILRECDPEHEQHDRALAFMREVSQEGCNYARRHGKCSEDSLSSRCTPCHALALLAEPSTT